MSEVDWTERPLESRQNECAKWEPARYLARLSDGRHAVECGNKEDGYYIRCIPKLPHANIRNAPRKAREWVVHLDRTGRVLGAYYAQSVLACAAGESLVPVREILDEQQEGKG